MIASLRQGDADTAHAAALIENPVARIQMQHIGEETQRCFQLHRIVALEVEIERTVVVKRLPPVAFWLIFRHSILLSATKGIRDKPVTNLSRITLFRSQISAAVSVAPGRRRAVAVVAVAVMLRQRRGGATARGATVPMMIGRGGPVTVVLVAVMLRGFRYK